MSCSLLFVIIKILTHMDTQKFEIEDGFVDLAKDDPGTIVRKVHALHPEPGVWTIVKEGMGKPFAAAQGQRMKILEAEIVDGTLKLKKIQFAGEKQKTIS